MFRYVHSCGDITMMLYGTTTCCYDRLKEKDSQIPTLVVHTFCLPHFVLYLNRYFSIYQNHIFQTLAIASWRETQEVVLVIETHNLYLNKAGEMIDNLHLIKS